MHLYLTNSLSHAYFFAMIVDVRQKLERARGIKSGINRGREREREKEGERGESV